MFLFLRRQLLRRVDPDSFPVGDRILGETVSSRRSSNGHDLTGGWLIEYLFHPPVVRSYSVACIFLLIYCYDTVGMLQSN